MQRVVAQLEQQGLHPAPLPLGLIRPGEDDGCQLCDTCNSFPCQIGAKSDAETCGIAPARLAPNVTVQPFTFARKLLTDPSGKRVEALEIEGEGGAPRRIHADLFVVACGAINSAALLLRSDDARPEGLANGSGLVGRHYMAHVTTMFSAWRWRDVAAGPHRFQKTVGLNDFYRSAPGFAYPLGHIQSQGTIHPEMVRGGVRGWRKPALALVDGIEPKLLKGWTDSSIQWIAMTEDLPRSDNRVLLHSGRIVLRNRPTNGRAHQQLVKRLTEILRQCGLQWRVPMSFGVGNTTHQCGTLRFGTDPATSVLDPWCRTHDVENLFVVDASFFPSSAAVNPGLTIVAQALRVADHIRSVDLR
jgi:choline dehydrogenase-like flavoprotein